MHTPTNRLPTIILTFFTASILTLLLSACGLIGDDDPEPTPTASSTSARVLQAAMSTEVNEDRQATGFVGRIFPAGIETVHAVVTLEGTSPGMVVTGRWFQLSVANVPAEGAEVSEAGVTLTDETVEDGRSRVALNVTAPGGLPEGDWVVRIYADGVFIRTMAFVITSQVSFQAPSSGDSPAPQVQVSPEPAATTAQITVASEYTVQAGDSLQSIAEEFKTPEESAESFIARLIQLNQLQPTRGIVIGDVLRIPGPQ